MEDQWSIVEFEDGMEMIPTFWITENKSTARWPNFTSRSKFIKAVQKRISYESDWPLYKIKKILTTSSTYDKGLLKLKKAELLSDLNSESDLEDSKKSRKERARKIISSDEDNDSDQENVQLLQFPKVPQKRNNAFYIKAKESDEKSKKQLKEIVPTNNEKTLEKSDDNISNIKKNNSDFISAIYNKDNSYDEPCANRYATSSEFQCYVIRKLTDIGSQISSLEEQGKVTNSRLNTIIQHLQTAYSHEAESEPVLQDVMNNFPIDNIEDLNKFEKLLMESQINRQKLMKELSRIGGNDIKRMVFNILRTLISDKLACMFNYIGGKKKRIFYDLEIRKVIFNVVLTHFADATEHVIAEPIKSWLRHANERYQKKAKDNINTNAPSTDTTHS